jgi:hypothetical protein
MKKIISYGFLLTVLFTVLAIPGIAQSPDKRVNFSINAPFALRMGDYVLPPGNYVMRQVLQNDLNLFALYPENLTNEPVAMIRTTRIDYQGSNYPEDTKIFIEMDEQSPNYYPVIQGWTIPGMDGWEVISVVEKKTGFLNRYTGKASQHKFDRTKLDTKKYDEKDKRSKIIFRKSDQ